MLDDLSGPSATVGDDDEVFLNSELSFSRFFKLITQEYISTRSKNLSGTLEFLCEVIEQQKPLNTWLEIFQSNTDSLKLTDMFIHLTLPVEIMSKFDQVILKNPDPAIQLSAMKFLGMVLDRVKDALNIISNVSLACDMTSVLEAYQQAILRVSVLISNRREG